MTRILGVLVGVLGVTVVAGSAYIASMRRTVEDLRGRVDRLEAKQRDAAARADVERLEEQVVKVEGDVAAVKRAPPPAPAPAAAAAPGASGAPGLTPDDLDQIIDQKVSEKVKARVGEDNGFGGKKRPLADVAKELGLPHDVEVQMAQAANEAKQEVFDILKTLRADGGNLVDDIWTAMKTGDQEKAQKEFMRIFKDQVPGTNETYFTAAIRVSDATMKKFEQFLTPEQLTKYKHTGVGPLDLETGFDPWAEYVKTKGG
jgi:hypothetical protein